MPRIGIVGGGPGGLSTASMFFIDFYCVLIIFFCKLFKNY